MKLKALYIIVSMFVAACCVTSCMDTNMEEYEASPNACITAFSIKDSILTYYPEVINGEDSLKEVWVRGANYPFVINQHEGLIYTADSLPYGTDVSKVVVNITADAQSVFIVAETDSLWEQKDSLDFTKPIQFKALSQAGIYGRTYTAKINVQQQDPDSMTWSRINTNFPTSIKKQKALYVNKHIYVFAEQEAQIVMTSADASNGKVWTEPATIDIPIKADYTSVLACGNQFYILANNQLYTSGNGINWELLDTTQKISKLLAAIPTEQSLKIVAIDMDNHYIESENGIDWKRFQEMPSNFPTSNIASVNYALDTNPAIKKIVLVGNNGVDKENTLTPWTQLNYDTGWIELEAATDAYACPKLENMGLIHYNNQLYVFGGKGEHKEEINPFSYFYRSTDQGISWEAIESKVMFPTDFASLYEEADGNYSYIVDDNQFFWIMWSQTGEVWRGRINKLGFLKK